MTDGRTRIKITLAGSLVYYFDAWVGPPTGGQDLILGMDFMVPAGIRLDLAGGSINLPDEVRIQLAGRRHLYGEKVTQVKLGEHCQLEGGESIEIRKGFILSSHRKLCVTRGERWVPSLVTGLGKTCYLKITNISDQKLVLQDDTHVGMWLEGGRVLRTPGFVLPGSRRYAEWQNLAFQSTTDRVEVEEPELAPAGPMVDRPQYDTPRKILRRDCETSRSVVARLTVPRPAEMKSETEGSPRDQEVDASDQAARESPPIEQATRSEMTADQKESVPRAETPPIVDPEPLDDEEVCYHEGGDLFAEDVERQMAILPEVVTIIDEVTIEDIQVGDPESNTPEEMDRLRQIIWRRKHLLIGKRNALPPDAVGAVCDIDVGGAAPVAQRARKVAPQFREKLSDLIKSLLSAKMITPSTSPWASPIVIIIKKNGVDIRLCIDYRMVNSLTRLMVYPMPLISDLLED
uniref:Reverse transcriptase n=1 Tax=Phytophthora ramorum TaxID=164328 RepID=H3H7B3_PHYRM